MCSYNRGKFRGKFRVDWRTCVNVYTACHCVWTILCRSTSLWKQRKANFTEIEGLILWNTMWHYQQIIFLYELRSVSTMTALSPEEATVKYSSKNRNNGKVASAQGTMGREKTREALLPLPFVLSFSLTPASPPYDTKRTLRRRERRQSRLLGLWFTFLNSFMSP